MKHFVVVSRYPHSPHYSIEGKGYYSQKEATKYIKLFKDRTEALDKIQLAHGFDEGPDKLYSVAEVIIPDKFFIDN